MVGSIVEQVFNKSYVLLKMNLFFVILSFLGGIVFGVGPAWYAISSLFQETGWDTNNKSFKTTWNYYKEGFVRVNKLSLTYLAVNAILLFNLAIAIQQKGLLFFTITLLILFILLLTFFLFNNSIQLEVSYDLSWKENIQLAITILFANFKELALQTGGLILLVFVTLKLPALLLFGTFAAQAIWMHRTLEKRFAWIDDVLAEPETQE